MLTSLPPTMQSKIVIAPCQDPEFEDDCWEWIGAIQSRGYGSFNYKGTIWSTHRLTYELLIGPIPDGLQIDHLCRNKVCCNPQHLEPVTGKVNCERTEQAQKTRCVNGHPLVGPNLIVKIRTNGHTMRNCRVCALDTARQRRTKRGQQSSYSAADKRREAIRIAAEELLLETESA